MTDETQTFADAPTVHFDYTYNAVGQRTIVAQTIDGIADAETDYAYDAVGRVSRMQQHGVAGGNAVAEKRVDYTYNAVGRYATIATYAALYDQNDPENDLVSLATYSYNSVDELTGLVYTKGATTLATYSYTYNAVGNMLSMTTIDGTTAYGNDDLGQLTADGGTTYTYDENGNRATVNGSTTYVTGADNRLLSDGTFTYTYDSEGNRTGRTRISTDPADDYTTEYTWDYRNRLTSVTFKDENGVPTKTVSYTYDAFNRWIGETIVEGETTTQTRYVYDGNEIIAQFDKSGTGDLTAADLSHRYLWDSQSVDHLFADETAEWNSTAERSVTADLLWALVDHQNSVRDLARYNAGTDTTAVVDHRVFDAYGTLTSDSNSAIDSLFGYTGRAHDAATGLQNNHNRWYDSITGRWLSQDPAGFAAGDANLYRYVGNSPTLYVDPSGLCGRGNMEAAPTFSDRFGDLLGAVTDPDSGSGVVNGFLHGADTLDGILNMPNPFNPPSLNGNATFGTPWAEGNLWFNKNGQNGGISGSKDLGGTLFRGDVNWQDGHFGNAGIGASSPDYGDVWITRDSDGRIHIHYRNKGSNWWVWGEGSDSGGSAGGGLFGVGTNGFTAGTIVLIGSGRNGIFPMPSTGLSPSPAIGPITIGEGTTKLWLDGYIDWNAGGIIVSGHAGGYYDPSTGKWGGSAWLGGTIYRGVPSRGNRSL